MQNKGIQPDITLPSTWDIEESSYDTALQWDEINQFVSRNFLWTSLISH